MKTVLFVGAGRHQRRAILRARQLGLRIVAVDRNEDAPGLQHADVAEVVDALDADAVAEVGRRHEVNGVITVAAERAVPVVAAVAEKLGLPGIGSETAHVMTHKIAMRRVLADAGVPQPRFSAVRARREIELAAEEVGFPAVLKPADSSGQRGLFLLESLADFDRHLHAALSQSPTGEAIIESFHEGLEINALLVARDGDPAPITLSDRMRPQGIGFGVALEHVYPSRMFGYGLEEVERVAVSAVRALGLRNGIAYPQLLYGDDGEVRVVEVAARIPGGQMGDLAWHATGIDLVEIALKQALGEPIHDSLVRPKHSKPVAIRFLTAKPGPLPVGTVRRVGGLERVLQSPGVVQADCFLKEGDTIRPVQVDGDRRGYVIAVGATNVEARDHAETGARRLFVEVE